MEKIIKEYSIDQAYLELDRVAKEAPRKIKESALKEYREYYAEKCKKSKELYDRAKELIPGGVQHNLALNHPFPLAMKKADGAFLWDLDDNKYIDFLQAGGPTLLGSNYKAVQDKVIELIRDCGPTTGLLHEYEYKIAEIIHKHMPTVEMFRMLASGSEATMASFRIARAATKHLKLIKVAGAYHGWNDQAIFDIRAAGTGGSYAVGVPEDSYKHTQAVLVNDEEGLEAQMKKNDGNGGTACVILEPIGPESGMRPCKKEYIQKARELCDKYGALLIFDEVVTGFRTGLGGAQAYFGVESDLTVFGKILGGGYPAAGAVGGKKQYMQRLAPGLGDNNGKVMVGGTLSANPLTCCAGYHTILEMEKTDAPRIAALQGDKLCEGMKKQRDKYGLPFAIFNQGSIVHLDATGIMNFTITPENVERVMKESGIRGPYLADLGMALTATGMINISASRMYMSLADTDEIVDDAIEKIGEVFSNYEKQ